MNRKGQVAVFLFMIATVIIILALSFAYPVNQMTTNAMNTTSEIGGMDCSNPSISDFTKAACWTMDISQGYFIGGLLALAGIAIAARIAWGA